MCIELRIVELFAGSGVELNVTSRSRATAKNSMGVVRRGIPCLVFISPSDLNFLYMANPLSTSLSNLWKSGGSYGTGLEYKSDPNQMYDALLKSNPYVGLTYHKTPWQTFLSSLGFRTDYDRFLEEAQVNANEYDAQVASIKQQNEYNSPSAEAQRMRSAGLNPDLLGTQGVSESASPIQDPSGMSPGSGEDGTFGEVTQKLWNFGAGIMSAFQMGVGLAKDMFSMRQLQNGVEHQDFELARDFMNFFDDMVKKSAPAHPFETEDQFNEHLKNIELESLLYPKKMHMSRRSRRIWQSNIRGYFNSDQFRKMTEDWLASSKNLDEFSKTPKNFTIYPVLGKDRWNAFSVVSDELGKLSKEVWKAVKTNEKTRGLADAEGALADLDYNKARVHFVDQSTGATYGQTKVAGEAASYGLQYQTAHIDRAMRSTLNRIVSGLEDQANNGDMLSAGLLLAFNIFEMSNWKVK